MTEPAPQITSRDVFPPVRLDNIDVFARLKRAVAEAGGQKAFAARHDISPQYLCDVLNSRRDVGPSVLRALGLRRIVYFEELPRVAPGGDA